MLYYHWKRKAIYEINRGKCVPLLWEVMFFSMPALATLRPIVVFTDVFKGMPLKTGSSGTRLPITCRGCIRIRIACLLKLGLFHRIAYHCLAAWQISDFFSFEGLRAAISGFGQA